MTVIINGQPVEGVFDLKKLHDSVQVTGPADGVPRPGAFLAALKAELEKIRADLQGAG